MTAFDADPKALAWARSKVQEYLDRLEQFEAAARRDTDLITAMACGNARHIAKRHFLGDGGDGYGVFDERLPNLQRPDRNDR
ncbi:hypothetical protein ACIQWN_28815 [Streptomyces vinaceus]|uniref:hypothetical protein n=1 Tax=Streptomyces vinaceus TaxID=1960 RepID=UPI003818996E